MTTSLKLVTPSHRGEVTYPITKVVTLIGRNPNCDIHLDRKAVSRLHARIRFDDHCFMIEDLHSSNGTFLNEKPLVRPEPLFHGDRIQICNMEFLFQSDRPEAKVTKDAPERKRSVKSAYLDESLTKDAISFSSQIDMRNFGQGMFLGCPQNDLEAQNRMLKTKLDVMMKMMRNLGKATTTKELIPQFLANLLRLFPQADVVALMMPDEKSDRLELVDYRLRSENPPKAPIRISRSIPQYVFDTERAVISDDPADDERFNASDDSALKGHHCSAMAAPIFEGTSQGAIGVILVDSRFSGEAFTEVDLDLLVSMASQAAVHHENLRYQTMRRQEEKMAQEMELAHQVQKGFLPVHRPNLPGYQFFDFYRPAKYLGGDYFDFIPLPDGRFAIVLADVSGKGIPAALLMAKLSSEVRSSLILEKTLAATMRRLNNVYCDSQWDNRFVTLAMLVIDPPTGEVQLFNAGHLYPIRYRLGGVVELIGERKQGFPIGIVPGADYEGIDFTLEAGESVILMSDGIPDAMNQEGEYFGMDRVITYLRGVEDAGPVSLGSGLLHTVEEYVGATSQSDDQCLVILGREEGGQDPMG